MRIIRNGILLILCLVIISFPCVGEKDNSSSAQDDRLFSKIFIDGVNADSNGFKLLLRASERHAGVNYQPYLMNINYLLKDGNNVIFSETVNQISIGEDINGAKEIYQPWHVALENDKNYTAIAEIYSNKEDGAEILRTTTMVFTATMDASITDIYADNIGASATVKGKSMVPLDANVIFTIRQGSRVVDTMETKAPFLTSNDREKTVDILWCEILPPGEYILSSELRGNEIIARYDKAITVKLKDQNTFMPHQMQESENSSTHQTRELPGFPVHAALSAILIVFRLHRDR